MFNRKKKRTLILITNVYEDHVVSGSSPSMTWNPMWLDLDLMLSSIRPTRDPFITFSLFALEIPFENELFLELMEENMGSSHIE